MIRRFLASALAVLALAAPVAALASPIPYVTAPFDTPNQVVNSAIQSINGANGIPTAALLTAATGSAGASTCNGVKCQITTESLATAASGTYTETVTNSAVTAASLVFCSVGTGGTGSPACASTVSTAGQVVVKIQTTSTAAAFNNTLTINLLVVN